MKGAEHDAMGASWNQNAPFVRIGSGRCVIVRIMSEGRWKMKFFVKWLITAAAVWVAVKLVPGINLYPNATTPTAFLAVAMVAAVLALLNLSIKPILKALTGCLLIITLGLFSLVINAGLLYFSSWLSVNIFGVGLTIAGFWPAFWGGIVISIVTVIVEAFTGLKDDH